jgi:hypothetical protein
MDDENVTDISSIKAKGKSSNFSLYMNDKKTEYTSQDAREDVDKIASKMTKIGRSSMNKICLTIIACSIIKTTGRVLIARNYSKKL